MAKNLIYDSDTLSVICDSPAAPVSGDPVRFGIQTGAGLTATINVLHIPGPGAGTLGAGTIATAHLAAGILSADAAGRGKFAANFFDEATVLAKFATDSVDNAELLKIV